MAYPSPCAELGSSQEHWVYRLLCQKANRRGIAQITVAEIATTLHNATMRVMNDLKTLTDMELIQAKDVGVWQVAERCPHQQVQKGRGTKRGTIVPDLTPLPGREYSPRGTSLGRSHTLNSSGNEIAIGNREQKSPVSKMGAYLGHTPKQPPKLTTVYLAKYYFPAQCRRKMPGKLGLQRDTAFIHQLNLIKRQGYDGEIIKSMIDIFMENPERVKPGGSAWKSFVARSDQLLHEALRRHENSIDHRWDGEEYWGKSDTHEEVLRKLGVKS